MTRISIWAVYGLKSFFIFLVSSVIRCADGLKGQNVVVEVFASSY